MSTYYKDTERDNDRAHTERYHQKIAAASGYGYDDSLNSNNYSASDRVAGPYGEAERRRGSLNPVVHEAYRRDREYEQEREEGRRNHGHRKDLRDDSSDSCERQWERGSEREGEGEREREQERDREAGYGAGVCSTRNEEIKQVNYNHNNRSFKNERYGNKYGSPTQKEEQYALRNGDYGRDRESKWANYDHDSGGPSFENEGYRNDRDELPGPNRNQEPYSAPSRSDNYEKHVYSQEGQASHPSSGEANWKPVATTATSTAVSQFSEAYEKSVTLNADPAEEGGGSPSSNFRKKKPSAFSKRLEEDEGSGIKEAGEGAGKVIGEAAGLFRKAFGGGS